MCLGIPGRIVAIEDATKGLGVVDVGGVRRVTNLACVLDGEGLSLAPFDWSVVLAGGAIPMPTLLQSLLPLVLGTPVLLRETARDPVTGRCLARSLAEVAPSLAKAFESIAVPSGDRHGFDALLEAPCVVATGSDETMRSLAARIAPHQRFVAYGHRFSIGVVGPGPEALAPEAIEGFALDVSRWDQSGCLSPVVLHLVGLEARARETFAHRLAEALDALGRQLPRGARSLEESALERRERSEARMRTASGAGLLIEGSDHTVVLEPDPTSRPAPLGRFVRLVPIASVAALDAALRPVSSHLATVAVVGFDAAADRELMEASSIRAASLVTRPGRLQTPPIDWPHDGRTLLQPLARFRQERSSPERFR